MTVHVEQPRVVRVLAVVPSAVAVISVIIGSIMPWLGLPLALAGAAAQGVVSAKTSEQHRRPGTVIIHTIAIIFNVVMLMLLVAARTEIVS